MTAQNLFLNLIINIAEKGYENDEIFESFSKEKQEVLTDFYNNAQYYEDFIEINNKYEYGYYDQIVEKKLEQLRKTKKEKNKKQERGFER